MQERERVRVSGKKHDYLKIGKKKGNANLRCERREKKNQKMFDKK